MSTTESREDQAGGPNRWRTSIDLLGTEDRETLLAEVERLLAGRVRDIKLTRSLEALFRTMTWRDRNARIRGWLVWVTLLNVPICVIDILQSPQIIVEVLISRLIVIPIIYGTLCLIVAKPRATWIEGLVLPIAVGSMMIDAGFIAMAGGGAIYERYLTAALAAMSTGLVIFPVHLLSTMAATAIILGAYAGFEAFNPAVDVFVIVTITMFFTAVLGALIPARWAMNIVSRHSFLLRIQSLIQAKALSETNARLAILADTDGLTALYNRRAITTRLHDAWEREAHHGGSVGVALIDVDHFKMFNDSAGHEAGDRCLIAVAQAIQAAISEGAAAGRYGGEEFIAFLPEATPYTLLRFGEGIREAVSNLALAHPGLDGTPPVSVSIGIALAIARGGGEHTDAVVREADAALYRAKAAGRHRVVAAWEKTEPTRAPRSHVA